MKKNLIDLMLPAPINGGFKMDGYWIWCGSVIKGEDGRYHMFSSRWKYRAFSKHGAISKFISLVWGFLTHPEEE